MNLFLHFFFEVRYLLREFFHWEIDKYTFFLYIILIFSPFPLFSYKFKDICFFLFLFIYLLNNNNKSKSIPIFQKLCLVDVPMNYFNISDSSNFEKEM